MFNKKYVKIIILIALVAIIATFFIFRKSKDSVKSEISKEIIKNVENAYTSAISNIGTNPTLDEVKSQFSMSDAGWIGDQIISDIGFACDVTTFNNYLKVKCQNIETKKIMILSQS